VVSAVIGVAASVAVDAAVVAETGNSDNAKTTAADSTSG
jgi:hypothetical protein